MSPVPRRMNIFFPPLPSGDKTGWRRWADAILRRLGPTWRASPVRRCLQAVSLGLFLHLFFYVSWPYDEEFTSALLSDKEWIPVELFLWMDPLVGPSTSIAARAVNVALIGAAVVLALSVLVPRGFCGYVCPLGTLIDLFDWLIGRKKGKRREKGKKQETLRRGESPIGAGESDRHLFWGLKYCVLAAVLAAAGFGVLLSGFVSAIPVVTRGMLFTLGTLQLGWMRNWGQVREFGFADWFSIGLLAIILLSGVFRPRLWCRYVCPSGAVFSLFSAFRLTDRKVETTCVGCGKCVGVCPFDAIAKDYSTRPLECTWCQTCGGVCPAGAIQFVGRFTEKGDQVQPCSARHLRWVARTLLRRGLSHPKRLSSQECPGGAGTGGSASGPEPPVAAQPRRFSDTAREAATPIAEKRRGHPGNSCAERGWSGPPGSRRGFLLATVAGAAAAYGIRKSSSAGQGSNGLLRPPGSLPEPEFLDLCIRCGQCFQVCPGPVLHPAGWGAPPEALWTPVAVPTHAGCHPDCNFCTQVCPTGAIRPLSVPQKRKTSMGLAVIDRQICLPHAGRQDCRLCVDECNAAGYRAIELRRIKLPLAEVPEGVFSEVELEQMGHIDAPFVDPEACVGCGLCEYRCHAALVKQEKLIDHSAVRMVAENADR